MNQATPPSTGESPAYDGYHKYDQAVAGDYDQAREVEAHWWLEDRFIEDYFKGKEVNHLLDLPVGTGRFFRHYSGVRHLTGVDISDAMLQEAGKKLGLLPKAADTRLERGDVFALKFGDGEFDATVVWRLFHLIPPEMLGKAIAELCRVTRGEIIAQTYTPAGRWDRQLRKMRALWRKPAAAAPAPAPSRKPAQAGTPEAKPWSHIRAYYHPRSFCDGLFRDCGFLPAVHKLLDTYEGSDVNATIYRKPARQPAAQG